jgi:mRNA-degrading endonuclease YafQ of YafQ-DinJ toxin-antitoxin module
VKKLIGIVFLSVLLLQVAGSYVYFIVRLSGIRQEMREQLKHKSDEQLTLLTFTADEYRKAKVNDHEVKVNGKMYDIARTVVQRDQVLVYALHDEAEDNLLALLGEMVNRSAKDKRPVPSQLIQLLTLQFVVVENKIPALAGISVIHTTPYQLFFSSFISLIESPPPRG